MLNQVYRLVSPHQFETVIVDEEIDKTDCIIVRPTYLSICHADQRYFTGSRDKKVLSQKLPMALIHEGIGEVIFDPKGEFKKRQRVVMIPNTPFEEDPVIEENYLRSSKFRSSGYDGYMQEYVYLRRDRAVFLPDNIESELASFIELISVSMHAISRLDKVMNQNRQVFGVWGDGNLGYISSVLIKNMFPQAKLIVFGKHRDKLDYFSFADETYQVDEIPANLEISNAVECTGGMGSQDAINQIIDLIKPQGVIALMGVSEHFVEVNTRMVLEKGLTVLGSSRSGREAFQKTGDFLSNNDETRQRLLSLIGIRKTIKKLSDVVEFFEEDLISSWGKSVMKWEI